MSHLLILAIPVLICPNRGNSPHPRSLQKLPLQVFALFSFSLVPLSKHCSKSHFHMALAGSTTAPCSILTVLGIVFFIIRFLCKAQILIYKDLAAVNTISTLCHQFSCQHSKNHLYQRGKCFVMVIKGNILLLSGSYYKHRCLCF